MKNIRKKIMDAAGILLLEKKKYDFRMEDIAETAGITKKTIYNHFKSRDELLTSAAGRKIQQLVEEMNRIVDQTELSFGERLEEIFNFAAKEYKALYPEYNPSLKKNEFFNRYIPIIKSENFKLVRKVIETGTDSGYLRNDVNIDVLTIVFLNTVESWGRLGSYGVTTTIENFFEFTRKVLLEGVLTTRSRQELTCKETGSDE